jgi:hypothetical protein
MCGDTGGAHRSSASKRCAEPGWLAERPDPGRVVDRADHAPRALLTIVLCAFACTAWVILAIRRRWHRRAPDCDGSAPTPFRPRQLPRELIGK